MRLFIDGKRVEYYRVGLEHRGGRGVHRWEDITVMGKTVKGRTAPVSSHLVPTNFLNLGGHCFTGGHHYYATNRDCADCKNLGWFDPTWITNGGEVGNPTVRCSCNPTWEEARTKSHKKVDHD